MIPVQSSLPLDTPRGHERERLAEAATRFEAIFARQMLAAARKADFGGDDLFGGQGDDTFRQMMDERFADILSESGALGFAKTIEQQLAAHIGAAAAQTDGKE